MRWIRTFHPELLENLNPTYVDKKMPFVGNTVSSSLIEINMGALDELFSGEERISQYVSTVAHELKHARDKQICDQSGVSYDQAMSFRSKLTPNWHLYIENFGEGLANQYLNQNPFKGMR